ncbi:hypothetical protein D9619_003392 [Psilocybe cf. subviscida]|uniref:Mitochondrial import inner membrane translocase subunit Tim21 n=1 Tax=Psilocybe cf. subviscida TaxID=2480587 RepID=A0A8H5AWZ3_9AGAR|nr:hypothetical protein D9619_003392 [Psilocybe cf. subviscida]
MSIHSLRIWTQSQCTSRFLLNSSKRSLASLSRRSRGYVTHNSMDFGQKSQLLSETLDGQQKRTSGPKHDNVGPFQLGLSQQALRKEKPPKKWSELSTGGKVVRGAARTSNLGVILLGAGLSALLLYSLTSELFSKNSPTVLYGDACDRLKQSAKLAKFLNGPLTFHNNPPSSTRPRHRNRHVTSRVMIDQYGQEHMIMTFYVQGVPDGEVTPVSDESYLDRVSAWVQEKGSVLTDVSFDETVEWSKETGNALWDKSLRLFKYLSGSPLPPKELPAMTPLEAEEVAKKEKKSGWGLTGMFSSLRSPRSSSTESAPRRSGRSFTEGEVHADFVKDQDGYFAFRYLLVDLPSSRDYYPTRVFVERQPGVRENEPVMRWRSS